MRAGARASQLAAQLRDRLIRHPKCKALVGWQSYYRQFLEEGPGRALVDHRGPHVGGEARHTELIASIAAGRAAVLISAPPGCGKSRFALELARHIERAQRSWDVRFVRHDEPALEEELRELPKASRVILIVDDAHDCPAVVERLASVCAAPGTSLTHLVCLSRPAGRPALLEAMASHFPEEPLEIALGRPDQKIVRELIGALIPQLSPHHRDVIRRFVADSYFATVLLCSSAARQKKLPQTLSTKHLRDYAVRQPIVQAIADLCPPEKAFRALAVYAACAPVRAGEVAVRASAAKHSTLPMSDIETLERRVLEAGLFHEDGQGLIRPHPGLVGDLILEETCLDEEGRPTPYCQSLLRDLLEQRRYEPALSNCSDIARLFAKAERLDFLSEMLSDRVSALSSQDPAEAADMLAGCAGVARRQPGVILRLIEGLTAKGILRALPPAQALRQADSLVIRAHRLLLSAGEYDPSIVPRALENSRQLLESVRAEDGAHRIVLDGLVEFCQFAVGRPLAHATAVLDVLKKWSEDSSHQIVELAASLVRGFLRLEMRSRRWEGDAPTLVSVGLNPTGDICRLRDQAVEVIIRCARHASPTVGYAAARSLGPWALGYRGLAGEQRRRWEPQLNRELDLLAATFAELGSATAHLPVRAVVEQQGWHWWTEGEELFIRRGGSRILEALPATDAYSLWKALHAPTLPIFPVSLDESIEPQRRPDHLSPLVEPSAARAVELARELLNRLDLLCQDASTWSALFASAVSALPNQPLQPRAGLYLKEFVGRHPDEAWSFVSEEAAAGPLGSILPALLAQLRGQNTARWHEAIRSSAPGTRLFEMELRALCAAGDLDDMERTTVSKGLELEDAEAIHLAAQALLSAANSALAPGVTAVLASLPRRSTDVRLWELALDAFARWGDHLLSLPPGEEPDPTLRAAAGELLRLLRTCASALSWDEGPHTRHLARALAILAVAVPHTLKSWIRQDGLPPADGSEGHPVLSPDRFSEVVRLLSQSSSVSFWQKQFVQWITEEPDLASIGARGLSELCGLSDPCIQPLVMRIVQQPSTASLVALRELIGCRGGSPGFIDDALMLLRHLADAPEAYALVEKEFIAATVGSDRAEAAIQGRGAALEAMDRAARDNDLPQALRQTLARARQAAQGSIDEAVLRGEAC
jgi:DNA polymerase III delta prime subunit